MHWICRMTVPLFAVLLSGVATADSRTTTLQAAWVLPPASRYDLILERLPFGLPPPPPPAQPVPPAPPPPPPPPFANKLVLSAINRTPAGIMAVGFTDNSQKPPLCFYMYLGETQDGYTVRLADFDKETATIEKDGVRVDLCITKGPTVASSPAMIVNGPSGRAGQVVSLARPASSVPVSPPANRPVFKLPSRTDVASVPIPGNVQVIDAVLSMGITNEAYLERLRQRRAEVLATPPPASGFDGEKAAAAYVSFLRRRNVEMIGAGELGLGFSLTKEESLQLAAKGGPPAQR